MASRPFASVLSTSKTAAALLLTIVASSAPVSSHNKPRTSASRSPRLPLSRVEFEGNRLAHCYGRGLYRGFRQDRAAEVGVQNGAGQVEDSSHIR